MKTNGRPILAYTPLAFDVIRHHGPSSDDGRDGGGGGALLSSLLRLSDHSPSANDALDVAGIVTSALKKKKRGRVYAKSVSERKERRRERRRSRSVNKKRAVGEEIEPAAGLGLR